ncbi:hypothetical protein FQR65_LT13623 [Abscondita terminalis]|nr:hypothetical protein FQR65_LT13623 [Abscondita terminalis]
MFISRFLAIFTVGVHLVSCEHFPTQAAAEWNKVISPFVNECAPKEAKFKEEVDEIVKDARVENDLITCGYLECLYEKLKFFGPNGEVREDVVMETLSYMTPEITKKCSDLADAEIGICKKSYVLGNCAVHKLAV